MPSFSSIMAVGDSSSKDTTHPLANILHMLTIKFSSTNFLLWRLNRLTATILSNVCRIFGILFVSYKKDMKLEKGHEALVAQPNFT
ncbi:hypothetical protein OSB04_012875 [Centaurea solstitialis]|uniref:Uncharacterized protein n=1 Tax=Centaurea solstitialis TaxID=347529 RepID=A0AA38WQX7_9ASTR|nr:hypothetical protein OSB04_012875 [Centaurea solstitialis]